MPDDGIIIIIVVDDAGLVRGWEIDSSINVDIVAQSHAGESLLRDEAGF